MFVENLKLIIISSSGTDPLFRLNFVIRFEEEVFQTGDNRISGKVISYFLLPQKFLICAVQLCNIRRAIFLAQHSSVRKAKQKQKMLLKEKSVQQRLDYTTFLFT